MIEGSCDGHSVSVFACDLEERAQREETRHAPASVPILRAAIRSPAPSSSKAWCDHEARTQTGCPKSGDARAHSSDCAWLCIASLSSEV